MKKWLTRCAVAATLIFVALLVVVMRQSNAPGIQTGQPLPPGKVRPQLANGSDVAVLLAPDGSLWAWGGSAGSLTNILPQPAISQVPRRIGSDSDWTHVAVGNGHAVALKNNGSLWAWGMNGRGQVGQANFTNRYGTPTRIGAETNWTQVCAGKFHSLALKNDGSLWAWGDNAFSQLGDGTTNNRSVPIMIGTNRDWRTIAASPTGGFALKSDGTIWGWGWGWSNGDWGLGLSVGSNDFSPKQIGSATNWLTLSAYSFAVLALKTDGTLWVEGRDAQRDAPAFVSGTTTNFTQIGVDSDWAEVSAGYNSFFARKKDGSWWVCGVNFGEQLGLGTNAFIVPSPQRLPFGFDPWAFAPGNLTTLMLAKDGKLWTWGRRLGAARSSVARLKIDAHLAPVVNLFPALRFLQKSNIDKMPHLLWELPPEVRRSLGTGPKSATTVSPPATPPLPPPVQARNFYLQSHQNMLMWNVCGAHAPVL